MKNLIKIPFTEIGNIPDLIKDFLNKKIDGFESELFSLDNFQKKISERQNNFNAEKRNILFEALKNQLSDLKLSGKQHQNLEWLKEENTFTITTGHQLNLFSGPVFFIYKILQTIKTAEFLNNNLQNYNFVPIFWLATEDHDFEEINHFKTENNHYEINQNSGGAVGKIKVSDQKFIAEFEEEFKNEPFGKELILMLKKSYESGNSLTQATKILVHRLFEKYGLLMMDGDDASLKKEMIATFKDELENQTLINSSKEIIALLQNKYGTVQVNPREINLFYLSETRDRIDYDGNFYYIVDKDLKFSKKEILQELENHPEKFSPNALMRPVFQETVLPNLAYIGGNAEIMYWLELKDYFKKMQLPFPVLVPRNSMLMLDEKTVKKMAKLDLQVEDLFRNFADLKKEKLLENNEILEDLNEKEKLLHSNFTELKTIAEKTDVTFGNMVEAEETRQLKSFDRFRKRLLRAEKIKQNELLERLENLFLKVHPGKTWQERVFNFSVFFAKEGQKWLEYCLEEMEIENSELIVIQL